MFIICNSATDINVGTKGGLKMNLIEYYKEKSLSIEGQHQIDTIRGCILASNLDKQDKREMLDFMTALEGYLEDEEI